MNKYLKILCLTAVFMLVTGTCALARVLYAPGGRAIDGPDEEVELWKSVGWYEEPVTTVTIYAPDGREAAVAESEAEIYLNWGWYADPVQYVYAPDGRVIVVKSDVVQDFVDVGWYTVPVCTMYSLDGSITVVNHSDAEKFIEEGWYVAPAMYVFSYEGKIAVIYQSELEAYEKVGWYELPEAYCKKIREYQKATKLTLDEFNELKMDDSSINSLMIKYLITYGGEIEYTLFDVDQNGVYELIFSKDKKYIIDIYTLNGKKLVKLYENCYFGDRSRLHILYDGSLLSEGSNGASTSSYKVHKISGSGIALVKVKFAYYDGTGKKSYMNGFDYLTKKDFEKNLNKYLGMSIIDIFNWNPLFE